MLLQRLRGMCEKTIEEVRRCHRVREKMMLIALIVTLALLFVVYFGDLVQILTLCDKNVSEKISQGIMIFLILFYTFMSGYFIYKLKRLTFAVWNQQKRMVRFLT